MPISITMRRGHDKPAQETEIPQRGQRIELLQAHMGVRRQGTVYYSDELQVLVKWDNGGSSSLRPGVDGYQILE